MLGLRVPSPRQAHRARKASFVLQREVQVQFLRSAHQKDESGPAYEERQPGADKAPWRWEPNFQV